MLSSKKLCYRSPNSHCILDYAIGFCLLSLLFPPLSIAQTTSCTNYWVNPTTGKVECLQSSGETTSLEPIPQEQTSSQNASSVRLNVPLIKQPKGALCGPASIEMVFRFWGEKRFDQYAIAQQIAQEYASEKRFRNSNFLPEADPETYPGTPAYIMKRYLNRWSSSPKYSLKELPSNSAILNQEFTQAFNWIKKHLNNGVPVIIHQYWGSTNSTGHYRVITGYNDNQKTVYLNDPKKGKIVQSYQEFKRKGAFKGRWLPYYSIAFNINQKQSPF